MIWVPSNRHPFLLRKASTFSLGSLLEACISGHFARKFALISNCNYSALRLARKQYSSRFCVTSVL
jgi:hypothetical protein